MNTAKILNLPCKYNFKGFEPNLAIKNYIADMTEEINMILDFDSDFNISIETIKKQRPIFKVCAVLYAGSERYVVNKKGRNLMALLKKIRRLMTRKIRQSQKPHWHWSRPAYT